MVIGVVSIVQYIAMRLVTILMPLLVLMLLNIALSAQGKARKTTENRGESSRIQATTVPRKPVETSADKPYDKPIVLENDAHYQSAKGKLSKMEETACCASRAQQLGEAIAQYEAALAAQELPHSAEEGHLRLAKAKALDKSDTKYSKEKALAAQKKLADLQKKSCCQEEQRKLRDFLEKCKSNDYPE